MPTYNFQNEQVTTDNTGKALSTAPITFSQQTASGALTNVQTAPSIPYTPPNPNTPVPATDLSANTILPPKAPTSDPTPFAGSVADSMKYFQDLYNKQTAQYDAAQKERDSLKNVLGESYGLLNSMPDAYKQQEQQMGIPQMYQDLNNLNLQMADLTGAYDKEFARVETKGIQSGTPALFYQGEQAAIQRQKAVEIGALGIRQAAMAGNLDLANQRLQKTIELQFAPIENKIKQTMQFLELNADDMTAAERRQSESLKLALAFQEQQLTQQKEDRSNALMAGVKSKFFKYAGSDTVYDTTTAKPLTLEQYQAMGGRNFTDITEFNPAETQQVMQIASKYPDAGILPSDTLATARAKLTRSRIYQDQVRGPVKQTDPYGDMIKLLQIKKLQKELGMGGSDVVDPSTDNIVKAIISSKQGDGGYGDTYDAVKARFGENTAKKYDNWYKQVFNQGMDINSISTQSADKQIEQATAKQNLDTLTGLLTNGAIDQAVGPNAFSRSTSGFWGNLLTAGPVRDLFNPGKTNYIGDVEKLVSQLSLDNLINAKARGATFGALSNDELKMLASAATKIGSWRVKDKQDNVIGYNAKESDFKKELNTILNFGRLDYVLSGGNPEDANVTVMPDGTFWVKNNDGTMTKL